MKFNKILLIGIDQSSLGDSYWGKIDKLTSKKVFVPRDSEDIKKELPDADCLLVNFGVPVTKDNIDRASKLKYIGTLSTAFGKVDANYARKKNIPVCNLAGYSTESVAEFTIAAVLEAIRGLETGKQRGRAGKYDESGIKAWELKNKVFGILGLGSIGRRVAELAQRFGADVRYWSKHRKKDAEKKEIKYQDADTLIPECDFISINFAQTKDTEKFLNAKRINSLKKNAVVINTAPMELVDVDALVKRLAKKDITFMFDHSDETDPKDMNKLSKYPNCIIYPPMAYITDEARIIKQEMFVSNIENFLQGKSKNVVN
ncbi:MAG: hypothetical protein A2868_03345 [Candidatus Levybacteria bacterium RIFCSPHIGHO2_01_FULL_40_15b]|nr:MAG: hypothetical protein A2868_03345 [Candidatus Levybacteria bacterium RIFCSPHIGHO2_01_FULL_40_15b]